jgi:hypothetical protein
MDLHEWAPPTAPTLPQQQEALRKGLGRAVVWARAGLLDHALLFEACLHDQRYDHQIESARSSWLWEIILACRVVDRFRGPLLEAFTRLPEDSAVQLCGLARHYATSDADFRARLYEVVRTKPIPTMDWLGEEDLIALDAEAGFVFVAGVRGDRLDREPWESAHTSLMTDAIERWGRERTVRLLEASNACGARRFLDTWLLTETEPETDATPSHGERMRAISVADILTVAAGTQDRCIWFRGWGRHAADDDLRAVLDAVLGETDPHRLVRLLRVFLGRPMPEFDVRILDLTRHQDTDVRDVAIQVLEPNTHPVIRSFGLELLAASDRVAEAVGLFIHNYSPGDETRIRAAMPSVPEDDLHWTLRDCEKVLHANERADPLPLGLFVYRHTPCGHCRESVAELLHRRGVLPGWVRDELRFDAYEDGRKLAATGGVGATPE